MKQFLSKHLVVLLAFALPIVVILITALTVYLPSRSLATKYDFVYATCGSDSSHSYYYSCSDYLQQHFAVESDRLVVKPVIDKTQACPSCSPTTPPTPHLFLHNSHIGESREITLQDAEALNLNGLLTSPDGLTISSGYEGGSPGFFLFDGGSSSSGYYLTKGKSRKKLNLITNDQPYSSYDNFRFLGWVVVAS